MGEGVLYRPLRCANTGAVIFVLRGFVFRCVCDQDGSVIDERLIGRGERLFVIVDVFAEQCPQFIKTRWCPRVDAGLIKNGCEIAVVETDIMDLVRGVWFGVSNAGGSRIKVTVDFIDDFLITDIFCSNVKHCCPYISVQHPIVSDAKVTGYVVGTDPDVMAAYKLGGMGLRCRWWISIFLGRVNLFNWRYRFTTCLLTFLDKGIREIEN